MTGISLPITDELVEAIAVRVAEILAEGQNLDAGAVQAGDAWLNVKEAAQHLACPVSRIYDLVAQGELDPGRDGRRLIFTRSGLDAYVRGRRSRARRIK